jgi:hypothetical protein
LRLCRTGHVLQDGGADLLPLRPQDAVVDGQLPGLQHPLCALIAGRQQDNGQGQGQRNRPQYQEANKLR